MMVKKKIKDGKYLKRALFIASLSAYFLIIINIVLFVFTITLDNASFNTAAEIFAFIFAWPTIILFWLFICYSVKSFIVKRKLETTKQISVENKKHYKVFLYLFGITFLSLFMVVVSSTMKFLLR